MTKSKVKTVLITGGFGFIGTNLINFLLIKTDWKIINFDNNCNYFYDNPRMECYHNNIIFFDKNHFLDKLKHKIDYIVHLAAETHVDKSIIDPDIFMKTNVIGTYNILNFAQEIGVKKFIHFSTDEVYGENLTKRNFDEAGQLRPHNPYALSKALGDKLVQFYSKWWNIPTIILRPCNNFGAYQVDDKFFPVVVKHMVKGKKIPVYGDGEQIREWMHVGETCQAVLQCLKSNETGIFNVGSGARFSNLSLINAVSDCLKLHFDVKFIPDRKQHDRRYAINSKSFVETFNFKPKFELQQIKKTAEWYRKKYETQPVTC